jgi:hypothetical protein
MEKRYIPLYIDILSTVCLHMDLLQGTLDMLVLKTLLLGPLHGYGIAKAIRTSSSDSLDIEFGSLLRAEATGTEGLDFCQMGNFGAQS